MEKNKNVVKRIMDCYRLPTLLDSAKDQKTHSKLKEILEQMLRIDPFCVVAQKNISNHSTNNQQIFKYIRFFNCINKYINGEKSAL